MTHVAGFRFYEELNDFLPEEKRAVLFDYYFDGAPTVKDAIEAIGVPHVEVDLILVNGRSVDFSCRLGDNNIVSVYPVFESLNISNVTHLREKPLRKLRFVADVHLGKLARYLRLCGFDTSYNNNLNDREIIDLSVSERRIILTRDRGILRNRRVTHGYWIRSTEPTQQLGEVLKRFDMKNDIHLFSRCSLCNTLLTDVSKEDILNRLRPMTAKYFSNFKICPSCNQIYWEGSHYDRMKRLILGEG